MSAIDADVADLERGRRLRQLGEHDLPDPAGTAVAIEDLGELLGHDTDRAAPALAELRAVLGEMAALAQSGFVSGLEWRDRRAEYDELREKLIQRIRAIDAFDLSEVLPSEPAVEPASEAPVERASEAPAEPRVKPAAEPRVKPAAKRPRRRQKSGWTRRSSKRK